MKIAISATGRDIESNIDATFERCPFFLIVDTKTKEVKALVNTTRDRCNITDVKARRIIMLGSLEKRILSVLHKERKTNAREIFKALREEGMTITYMTVNTVLSRLYKRGFVKRTKEPFRGTFRYTYEYKDIEDELIDSLLEDVDIIFGKEGIDHLKMKLDALGIATGQIVASQGVDVVITADIGLRAFEIFEQYGINMYQASGKIKDAIRQFKEEKLPEITMQCMEMDKDKIEKAK